MITRRLFGLGLLSACALPARPAGADAPRGVPALASVIAFRKDQAPQRHQAFVVEAEGFLMTRYEALIDPDRGTLLDRIEVELAETPGRRYPATIVSVEPTLHFAVLKIDAGHRIGASTILDRERIVPGLAVYAVAGEPGPAARHVRGTVSGLNSKECYQESLSATMLKLAIELPDEALGGPVFDADGAIIGLHTGDSTPDDADAPGERHVLPIFLAFNIYDSIKQKKSFRSPWTGFSVRPLTEAEQAIFPIRRFFGGIAIEYVWKDSPADRLGLREGDILVRFAYYPIRTPAAFQKWLYLYGVGETVKLHFIRNGQEYLSHDYLIKERPAWAKPR